MAALRICALLAAVAAAADADPRCWREPDRAGYVLVSEGTFTIPDFAFDGCRALSSISLPTTLTALGARAFANTSLTRLVIPSTVIDINPGVLDGCDELVVVSCASEACDPTANSSTARQYDVEYDAQNSSWSFLETCCECPSALARMLDDDGASCSCGVTLCNSSTSAGRSTSPISTHSTASTASTAPGNSTGNASTTSTAASTSSSYSTTSPHSNATVSTAPGNSSNPSTTSSAASTTSSRPTPSSTESSRPGSPSSTTRPGLAPTPTTLSPEAMKTAEDHKANGTAAVVMVIVIALLGGAGYFAYTGGCCKSGGGALLEGQARVETPRKPKKVWRARKKGEGGGYSNPFAEFNNPNDVENDEIYVDEELDTFA